MKRKLQVGVRHPKLSQVRGQPQLQRRAPNVPAGQSENATYIPASEAKNNFAAVIDGASQGREIFITRHSSPKVVVISVEKYKAMTAATMSVLDRLTVEFDARLSRMQKVQSQKAMKRAFDASPHQLGKAALKAARSRS